ncbi:MAG: hypothetical protein KBT36_05445 [Kurthia sp.]|nr:hypothetical protein [Candidatus Kurthia equi]
MKSYHYQVTTDLQDTQCVQLIRDNEVVGQMQRVYSNALKKFIDSTLDKKYFVRIESKVTGFEDAYCRKIQRKGKVYYEAVEQGKPIYRIAYIGWKSLIPDLAISNKEVQMILSMEREDWSVYRYEEKEVARWRATLDEEKQLFSVELQIEDDCPFDNPALLVSISHASLFIGA